MMTIEELRVFLVVINLDESLSSCWAPNGRISLGKKPLSHAEDVAARSVIIVIRALLLLLLHDGGLPLRRT